MAKKKKKKRNSSSRKNGGDSVFIQNKKKTPWRIYILFSFLVLIGGGLIFRLYTLQIQDSAYYSALARGQGVDLTESAPPRGDIYFQDKGGSSTFIAATNRKTPVVYANPKELENATSTFREVSALIEAPIEDKDQVLERLNNKESSYAKVSDKVSEEEVKRIEEKDITGIYTTKELQRYYPAEDSAAQILGFLGFRGKERTGQYGVEEYYNEHLAMKNSDSEFLSSVFASQSDRGDLELTIDYGVQFRIEKRLKALVEKWGAESANAIFMNPKTGEIIAMTNVPSFNPNKYSEVEDVSRFNNTTVQSRFEFGSVFKPITMAAALDKGVITPKTTYEDAGSVEIGGHTIHNSDGESHGIQTMTQVLEKSLNTGVVFVQQKLGEKSFREYLKAFQLDEEAGVDLPGDIGGDIENIKNTNRDINFATAAFGQGISFSPLRFLTSLSAVANDGKIIKPHIAKERDNKMAGNPISSLTASRVTAMMVSVVENGFGEKAKVPGYTVAGKTGTAQIPKEDAQGYSDKTLHSFVGFAPAYNPRFIGIITLKDPKGVRFSSDSVAPAFGDISSFLLQYYNIPPQ